MRRWNRKQRVIRNLLLSVLLGLAAYALLGFPPYTTGQKLDRLERKFMLEDLEPVYVQTGRHRRADQLFGSWYTLVMARSPQGNYVSEGWEQSGLKIEESMWERNLGEKSICQVWGDAFYVAADALRNAVCATAVVETKYRTFTLEGQPVGEGVFSFAYLAPDHDYNRFAHGQRIDPGTEIDLLDAVELWYWENNVLVSQDLSCTVTARDQAGKVLGELELSLDVMELDTQHFYRW